MAPDWSKYVSSEAVAVGFATETADGAEPPEPDEPTDVGEGVHPTTWTVAITAARSKTMIRIRRDALRFVRTGEATGAADPTAAGMVVIGSGLRRSKLALPGALLAAAPGVELVDGLALG